MWFHLVRKTVNERKIVLQKIETTDNFAYMVNNVVTMIKFKRPLLNLIYILEI